MLLFNLRFSSGFREATHFVRVDNLEPKGAGLQAEGSTFLEAVDNLVDLLNQPPEQSRDLAFADFCDGKPRAVVQWKVLDRILNDPRCEVKL
ncbi:MAG: hypothetical protein ACFB2W_00605 [Leptolyngbyaceae cyanobacterium]